MRQSLAARTPGPLARWRWPANHPRPLVQRLAFAAGEAAVQGELAREPALAVIEAALLAADEPLTPRRLAKVVGSEETGEVRKLLRKLQGLYERDGTAFELQEIAGGFQLLTRPDFHPWLTRLKRSGNDLRLTAAMRETLAIVAYRQPIMRADVEKVRGVHAGEVLRQLMEKGLVRIAGRDTSLGRPVLYATTKKFLQVYGLKSLRDLPLVEQLQQPKAPEAKSSASSEPKQS